MANNNINEMTRAGYEMLQEELKKRQGEIASEISARLEEARGHGDLSENAEYDAAKDDQAANQYRIEELEEQIRTAVVVEDDGDISVVQTGRLVTLKDHVYDEEVTYQIVGEDEANPIEGKLSNSSLVGEHLMGSSVGDVIEFAVPEGTAKYEILKIAVAK